MTNNFSKQNFSRIRQVLLLYWAAHIKSTWKLTKAIHKNIVKIVIYKNRM